MVAPERTSGTTYRHWPKEILMEVLFRAHCDTRISYQKSYLLYHLPA